jgi:CubicO group peptidase (beta-lactamase class C family)
LTALVVTLLGVAVAAPGTVWNYNSGGVWLLGVLASKQSGQPLEEFAKASLFEPLWIRN